MWIYEKRLQFPVNIKETNAQLAQAIISQYGGLYTNYNKTYIDYTPKRVYTIILRKIRVYEIQNNLVKERG